MFVYCADQRETGLNHTVFLLTIPMRYFFVDHLCYLCLVFCLIVSNPDLCPLSYFVILLCLFMSALWSPAGKGLTSWISFVMFNCVFVSFLHGILGQVWYLIVSILDLYQLSYFDSIARLQKHPKFNCHQSKKKGKSQESIQSNTTPDLGYQ